MTSHPDDVPGQPAWSVAYEWSGPPRLRLEEALLPGGFRQHRMVTQDGRPGVVVLALADDSMLFVRQHRPVVGASVWELPRGFGEAEDGDADSDSALIAAAVRELREEAGLALHDASVLGRWWPDSGLLAGSVGAVAGSAGPAEGAPADPAIAESRWFPCADLASLVRHGVIQDGLSLAAIALWRAG